MKAKKKSLKKKSQSQSKMIKLGTEQREKNAYKSNPQRGRRTEILGERDPTGEEQNTFRPASKNSSWLGTVGKG